MTKKHANSDGPIGISVVVPSRNHGRFIDDTLRSILDQDYPNVEILVMDGASTDDTVERLRAYGQSITWQSEPDGGQSAAIAAGFAKCTKSWMTWLNSDDVQCNRALWRLDHVVKQSASADVVIGEGHYMDIDGQFLRFYPTIPLKNSARADREFFNGGYVAQPSVFFRRDLYERVGGLNQSLHYCMDYELWCRFAAAGATFCRLNEDISGNRWYETTKTSANPLELYAEVIAVQHKIFGAASPYFVQAVSDHLYSEFHSKFVGDNAHLYYRTAFFKGAWLALNARAPLYCLSGFFRHSIAKSGPIANDVMSLGDYWRGFLEVLRDRRGSRQ